MNVSSSSVGKPCDMVPILWYPLKFWYELSKTFLERKWNIFSAVHVFLELAFSPVKAIYQFPFLFLQHFTASSSSLHRLSMRKCGLVSGKVRAATATGMSVYLPDCMVFVGSQSVADDHLPERQFISAAIVSAGVCWFVGWNGVWASSICCSSSRSVRTGPRLRSFLWRYDIDLRVCERRCRLIVSSSRPGKIHYFSVQTLENVGEVSASAFLHRLQMDRGQTLFSPAFRRERTTSDRFFCTRRR